MQHWGCQKSVAHKKACMYKIRKFRILPATDQMTVKHGLETVSWRSW